MKNEIAVQNEVATLMGVIQKASVTEGVDIGKLEKLLDMHERLLKRDAVMQYNQAFVALQDELPEIAMTGEIRHNGKLISKYSRIEDIMAVVKPLAKKHGFGIRFDVRQDEGSVTAICNLIHIGGHSESAPFTAKNDTSGAKNAAQGQGSALSYAKRYALCAVLNITMRGVDDDGEGTGKRVSSFQKEAMKDVLMECSTATQDWFREAYGAIDDVPAAEFTAVYEKLRVAKNKAKK